MIAEIFLDSKISNLEEQINKFKQSVLETLKSKNINNCTILSKEVNDKIHVVAISCMTKDTQQKDLEKDGFSFVKTTNINNKVETIEPNTISFDIKKLK